VSNREGEGGWPQLRCVREGAQPGEGGWSPVARERKGLKTHAGRQGTPKSVNGRGKEYYPRKEKDVNHHRETHLWGGEGRTTYTSGRRGSSVPQGRKERG